MRISDWSSDVCSSDLLALDRDADRKGAAATIGRCAAEESTRPLCRCDRLEPRTRHPCPEPSRRGCSEVARSFSDAGRIGRAVIRGDTARQVDWLAARSRIFAKPRKDRTIIRTLNLSASAIALAVPAAAQPAAKVAAANEAALQEPPNAGLVPAAQNRPYTEGALYRLYASPER